MGTTGTPRNNNHVGLPENLRDQIMRVTDHLDQIYTDAETLREAEKLHRRVSGIPLWKIFRELGG